MYKYTLVKEVESKVEKFQEKRINAFDEIEKRLEAIKKPLRLAKINTIKYYRDNPTSYSVVTGTDLINDYISDIETLLKNNKE